MKKKIIIPLLVLLVAVGTAIGVFVTNKSASVSTAVTMPYCNGQKVSNRNGSSLRFDFTIKNPSRVSVPQCGVQIRPKGGGWSTHTENIVAKHRTLASCPVWYEVGKGKEFNYTINGTTTYELRGFCKYGGNTYYSGIVTSPGNVNISVTNCRGTGVGSNGFKLEFTINNPSRVSIPECGARIRKSTGSNSWSAWTTKSESIVSNHRTLASIPAWYQVGSGKEFNYAISANTQYQIQGYCKYNGNTYWSNTATVRTVPTTTNPTNGKKTADQAIAWCRSRVGQPVEVDGSPSNSKEYRQCVDLTKGYAMYLGATNNQVRGSAKDYATPEFKNRLPSGWKQLQGVTPQKGDILVWTGGPYNLGHVAVFESNSTVYHQRWLGHDYVETKSFQKTVSWTENGTRYTQTYWGVIRPVFA